MTPEEKKKKKRGRVWRIAAPAVLAGMFAALALLENAGVFAAVKSGGASASLSKPASVPVPLTKLAVVNRLENDGFFEHGDMLLRNGVDAGLLFYLEKNGTLSGIGYTLILLPANAAFGSGSGPYDAQADTDRETASFVFRALLEAVLGGISPNEKQLKKGESILDSLFSSDKEKTETLEAGECTVTFTKAYSEGVYVLTLTAERGNAAGSY